MGKGFVFEEVNGETCPVLRDELVAYFTLEFGGQKGRELMVMVERGERVKTGAGVVYQENRLAGAVTTDEVVTLIQKSCYRYLLVGESVEVTVDDVVSRHLGGRGGSELHGFVVNVVGGAIETAMEEVKKGELVERR